MKKSFYTILLSIAAFSSFGQAGTLDSSFGINGVVNSLVDSGVTCYKVLPLSGNRLLTAGTYFKNGRFNVHVTRYKGNGTVDSSFGINGTGVALDSPGCVVYSAVKQPDGKVIVCGDYLNGLGGYNIKLVRFDSSGALDNSFGVNGRSVIQLGSGTFDNVAKNILLQPDGKIIIAGNSALNGNYDFLVMRCNSDGTLDPTYGNSGYTVSAPGTLTDNAYAIAMQNDGKLVHVGDRYDGTKWSLVALRYDTSGHLDNSFGTGGQIIMPVGTNDIYGYSVIVQNSQKIVVGAYSQTYQNTLLRFNTDGTLDNTFDSSGFSHLSFKVGDVPNYLDTLSNGDIIMAGRSTLNNTFAFAKFSRDGKLDTSIGTKGLVVATVNSGYDYSKSVAVDGSNNIIIGGYTNTLSGYNIVMARFKSGVAAPVSIKNTAVIKEVFLVPNPANSHMTLQYALTGKDNISIIIYDASGKEVQRVVNHAEQNAGTQKINFSLQDELPPSNYLLTIYGKNGMYGSTKFIKE